MAQNRGNRPDDDTTQTHTSPLEHVQYDNGEAQDTDHAAAVNGWPNQGMVVVWSVQFDSVQLGVETEEFVNSQPGVSFCGVVLCPFRSCVCSSPHARSQQLVRILTLSIRS